MRSSDNQEIEVMIESLQVSMDQSSLAVYAKHLLAFEKVYRKGQYPGGIFSPVL